MFPMERLNGHNSGLGVQFINCKQNTGFCGGMLDFDQNSEREHVMIRPTAINQFKRLHYNPPLGQRERSHGYNFGMGHYFGKIAPNT